MTEFVTEDSGEREEFDTGAKRDTQTGKSRFDLVPSKALRRVADLYARGAEKYDENNWMKGISMSRTLASLERHLHDFKEGENPQEDHLAAVVWNALALIHYQEYPQYYSHLYDLPDWTQEKLSDALHLASATEVEKSAVSQDGFILSTTPGVPDHHPV